MECRRNKANQWELYVDRRVTKSWCKRDQFKFEVSEIYIVVEEYSEDKLKLTENYKKLFQLRDQAALKEKLRIEEQNRNDLAYAVEQKEKHDLKEYVRLQKKYSK